MITEATEEEIKRHEEITLSQNTYRNNNLLNLNYILEFEDKCIINVEGIIDTRASKYYITPDLIPSKYIESALYKAEVKDAFGKITTLENKVIDCKITYNNIKYLLPFIWVRPALGKKVARFFIGKNFIKHKNGIIIVYGKNYYTLKYR